MSAPGAQGDDGTPSFESAVVRTPYVMVPVPEEFEDEISRMVLRTVFRETLMRWDDHAVRRLHAGLDERSWALIVDLARAGRPADPTAVADRLGVTAQEFGDLRARVTATCTELERLDLVVAAPAGDPPAEDAGGVMADGGLATGEFLAIRDAALPAVLRVIDEVAPSGAT